MVSLVFLALIFEAIERQSSSSHWRHPSAYEWSFLLGGFSLVFMITLGLFFRIDLTRKFVQVIAFLLIIVWIGVGLFILSNLSSIPTHRSFNREFFPFIGVSMAFLCYMIGLFTLFGNRVVKEEFALSRKPKSEDT